VPPPFRTSTVDRGRRGDAAADGANDQTDRRRAFRRKRWISHLMGRSGLGCL
jgi:hypothetical protein